MSDQRLAMDSAEYYVVVQAGERLRHEENLCSGRPFRAVLRGYVVQGLSPLANGECPSGATNQKGNQRAI